MKKLGQGATLSALTLTNTAAIWPAAELKPIRIGIIGAENSHTRGFGKLFNIDKSFPEVSVKYVWGETEAFAKDAMERGAIPNMVKDPKDMLGKIDALIVDHRHGKFHLAAARPFVEAGIPTFIDKPFCYRLDEGREFLAMARERGTPVTSYSSIAHSHATDDLRAQLQQIQGINQLIRTGPVDLSSEYGGVFFYGPHVVEPLIYMFDQPVVRVRVNKNGKNSGANLVFADDMMVSVVFTTKKYGWQTFVETDEGVLELTSKVSEPEPGKNYIDMVEMFRSGKEPRSHESILRGIAVLEALEKSTASEQWETVEQ